jgi:hypothetical protein
LSLYSGSSILLGLYDDAVVATCTLIIIPNLTRGGASYALIENVVTDARHWKRGYGKLIPRSGRVGRVASWLLQGHVADGLERPGDAQVLRGGWFRAEQDGVSGAAYPCS